MADNKELNTDLNPGLARQDLLETFAGIFSPGSNKYALAIHDRLGFIALAEGEVEPEDVRYLSYTGLYICLARYTDSRTNRPMVKIWGHDEVNGAEDFIADPRLVDAGSLTEITAVRDRVTAHMCEFVQFMPAKAEETLEDFIAYLEFKAGT